MGMMIQQKEVLIPFVDSNDWLATVLSLPEKLEAILVICHGLTGNKTGPQMFQKVVANTLVQKHILVVRFDFRGSGDSSGTFFETDFSKMIEDTERVVSYVQTKFPNQKLFFLGLSIGAIVSSVVASKHGANGNIIISNDLAEGISIPNKLSIREGEFYVNRRFWEERSTINIRTILRDSGVKSKLFYGSKDKKVCKAANEVKSFIECKSYQDMDHLFGSYDVRQTLSNDIAEFITNCVR